MDEPRRLGDYEILTELATGGVATVYAARHVGDAGFERLVAIKRVHRHLLRDPDVFASLADEARISALVHHPNVVATHEVLDQKGELCLVQAYVEGVSLALLHKRAVAREAKGLLPVDVVARIALDFLRGLHAAHEAVDLRGAPLDLVHRDVSPQNVLVGADGVSRLIDFGIARAEGRITETRGGILKGKLSYMAPEQVGEKDVDRRADLFAAGVVLFELLAGARPFDGAGDAESMARILAAEADFTAVEAQSPELAPIVARALAREPDARWDTAEALAEAIAEAIRPASDAVMRALVKSLAGDLLEERREAIREELGRAEEEAMASAPPTDRTSPSVSPSLAHASSPAEAAPARGAPSRGVVAVLAVGALVLVVTLLTSLGDRDPRVVDPSPAESAARAATAPQPSTPAAQPEPTSLLDPSPPAPATEPKGRANPASVPAPAIAASSRVASPPTSSAASVRPGLHGNPYGP